MIPELEFPDPARWRTWLARNHRTSEGVWLRIRKKGAPDQSVTYAEALDEALCFGWIDGVRKRSDDQRYQIRFTPRKADATWSSINIERVSLRAGGLACRSVSV